MIHAGYQVECVAANINAGEGVFVGMQKRVAVGSCCTTLGPDQGVAVLLKGLGVNKVGLDPPPILMPVT